MINYNKERLQEIYDETQKTITKTAKIYCKEVGIEYSDSVRRAVSKILSKRDSDIENITSTETNQYDKVSALSALKEDGTIMSISEYCKSYNIPEKDVKSYKLVTHTGRGAYYNIASNNIEGGDVVDFIQDVSDIVSKYIKPLVVEASTDKVESGWFDRLVYTDTHLGMDVNSDGDPLYKGKWDREEALSRMYSMVKHVVRFKKSNTLYIDDLGDFLDGLGGQTTRKGHSLPQNMNDKEVFDLSLEFKISLVDSLMVHYDTIVCNDVTEDNHAGVFSYFTSTSIKQILELKYPGRVRVNTLRGFMEHYSVGMHTFILCHGKDSKEMKFGFKPKLDAPQAERIDQYCKENGLYNGNQIEFSKGDSHQGLYDDSTSNDFQYYNYPSLAPPSNWVKVNFKNTHSGFKFYNIKVDENLKTHHPYIFKNKAK